jgi:hypothetical protein
VEEVAGAGPADLVDDGLDEREQVRRRLGEAHLAGLAEHGEAVRSRPDGLQGRDRVPGPLGVERGEGQRGDQRGLEVEGEGGCYRHVEAELGRRT